MRTLLVALLLVAAVAAGGQDAPKALTVSLEPLGDRDRDVVARVFFRFANPRSITEAGLFLEGTFTQAGHVPRHFRFAVPRKGDRLIWNNTFFRNQKLVRHTRWSLLPDKRNEMSAVHAFAQGEAEIDVWLILEADYEGSPTVIARATETFTLTKSGRPYAVDESNEDEAALAEELPPGVEPEDRGAVSLRASRRELAPGFYLVSADVEPPVRRVEFWVGEKKIVARNAPPYDADLELGESPKDVALRAIGFDATGHYVDADAVVVGDDAPLFGVKVTYTATSDGFSHFKLSVRNPAGVPLQRVVLYAGEVLLHEWRHPPYALSVSTASLASVPLVRAMVVDEGGTEASDLHALGEHVSK